MSINPTNIRRYAAAGRLYVFADKPADTAFLAHTAGVPAGYHTREVGGTIGAATFEYRPSIGLTDVEQFLSPIAPRLQNEQATLRATLAEASYRNLELALQQAVTPNMLAELNSSFELDSNSDGTADNWSEVGTSTRTIQTDAAITIGTKSQQFLAGVGVPGGIKSANVEHPRLIAGAITIFSAYLKAASGTPSVRLKTEAFNSAGVSQGSNTASSAITTSFARYSLTYTLPASTAYVVVTVDDATGQNIAVKVDNVQLEVPLVGTAATAAPYVGHKALFVGGRSDVTTLTVVLMSQQTDRSYYNSVVLYDAYVSDGASVPFKKGETRQFGVTFTGVPDLTRTAGDQLFQIVEEHP
jgi:hypothetical protein